MRVLALGPESYGGFAGIAQGTRDFLDGLLTSEHVDGIDLLARRVPDGGPPAPSGLTERTHPGWSPGYASAALGIAARTRPGFVFCLHVNLMPVAAALRRVFGAPVWLAVHGIEAWEPPRSALRRSSVKAASFVTSSSRYTRERFLAWSGVDPARAEVNNNPVHLERWAPGPKPAYLVERYGLAGRRVLTTLGRMLGGGRYKGHDEILAVLPALAAEHDDLTWLIVGDGPDGARIERAVHAAGMTGRVVFAGRVPEEEKRDHYLVSDAYALPSRTEGFGIAYLEAAACGIPVLGSVVDGSRDALADGRIGVLVDPDDRASLLAGLRELLARGKGVPPAIEELSFERMAARMRRMVAERFAPGRVAA